MLVIYFRTRGAPPATEPNKGTQIVSPTAAAPGLPRGGRPKPTCDQPIEQSDCLQCRDEEELCRSLNGTRALANPVPINYAGIQGLCIRFFTFRGWPQIGSLEWSVDPLLHPAILLPWRVLSADLAGLSADDQFAFMRKYGPTAPRGTFRNQPATQVKHHAFASRRSSAKGGEKPRSRFRRSVSRSRSKCR
ncbi:hypothetical protein ElyMa_000202600 [Elysia marginata]|uniref:Uncharacterized protein n=1 Tax=Elysia marginata TaxID=1093978 RepID=A0AAV4EXG8_9GAST|nr:hypothetical protein ElyMa_000202600 [Elysia marginata]